MRSANSCNVFVVGLDADDFECDAQYLQETFLEVFNGDEMN
jgi:hypothetical protein